MTTFITDWLFPATAANVARTSAARGWINPGYATNNDDLEAEVALNDLEFSDWLRVYSFGAELPPDANVVGVEVEVEKRTNVSARYTDSAFYMRTSSAQIGDNKADTVTWWLDDNFTTISYGGSADMWGTTVSAAQINASGWGFDYSAIKSATVGSSVGGLVDFFRARIYYQTAGSISLDTTDGLNAHSAENVGLSQVHGLNASDSRHLHFADQPGVSRVVGLGVADAAHAHAAEAAGLFLGEIIGLSDGAHAHAATVPGVRTFDTRLSPVTRTSKVMPERRVLSISQEARSVIVPPAPRTKTIRRVL